MRHGPSPKKKIDLFIAQKEEGTLNEYQKSSYFARAIDRQKLPGSTISMEEVREIVFMQLFAAVDTTSSGIGWNLLHLARLPHIQEKLYQELKAAVDTVGNGKLNEVVLDKRHCPYLHAVLRETARLTPLSAIFVNKGVGSESLKIHGETLHKEDVISLEGYGLQMDPKYVDDPEEFIPERWFDDAVEARKGTEREVLDHPFFRGPFSQGARRCPGSRVATNEIQILVSQLVLDWKMSVPVRDWKEVKYEQLTTIEAHLPEFEFTARA